MTHLIESTEELIRNNMKYILHAGDIFYNKISSAPPMTAINIGMKTEEKEKKDSMMKKIFMKIGLLPKTVTEKEQVNVPIFYMENSYLEYEKRIKQLEKKS